MVGYNNIPPPPLMNDAWRQFKLRQLEPYQTFRRDLNILYKNCETSSLTTIKERSLRVYGIWGEYCMVYGENILWYMGRILYGIWGEYCMVYGENIVWYMRRILYGI